MPIVEHQNEDKNPSQYCTYAGIRRDGKMEGEATQMHDNHPHADATPRGLGIRIGTRLAPLMEQKE